LGRLRHEELLLAPVFTQRAQCRQLLRVKAQLGEIVGNVPLAVEP
jgi:hypothetical protein